MKDELLKNDLKYNWHPYTQMKDCEDLPPVPIKSASGVKLFDYDGNFYYDTISSWWCNVHGHNHPKINEAIKRQISELDHVLFAGFTHKPAVELSERLARITPDALTRVFYSDNGSTAVEIAMKMSLQYWSNSGVQGKTRYAYLDMGYHGDTIGTMSVSGTDHFHSKFESLFFESHKVPTPYCYRCPVGREKASCGLECLAEAEKVLKENADSISAFLIEPMMLGAGGMIIYPAEYLKGIRDLTNKYGVHLIADEVASGFGRTGKMFACEHAGVVPDFICISKGVTSGYMPLGVTLTTEEVYNAFYDDYEKMKTFFHGHTFTANPISCSAAVASIDLFDEERTLDNVMKIEMHLSSFLESLKEFNYVGDIRNIGAVGAVELVSDRSQKTPFDAGERIGVKIYKEGLKNGLLLRPLGNVIYLFLPLAVQQADLDDIFIRVRNVLTSVFTKR